MPGTSHVTINAAYPRLGFVTVMMTALTTQMKSKTVLVSNRRILFSLLILRPGYLGCSDQLEEKLGGRPFEVKSCGAVGWVKMEWIYSVSGNIVRDLSMILIQSDGE
jgi:hypothetical protein